MIVSVLYRHIQQYLNTVLENMANKRGITAVSTLTSDIHVWPDFHGNRSPLADASLSGMVIVLQFVLYINKSSSYLRTECLMSGFTAFTEKAFGSETWCWMHIK
jgi:ribulose kinase